jgi:hypothetical protein
MALRASFLSEFSLRFPRLARQNLFFAEQGFSRKRTGNYREPIRDSCPTFKGVKISVMSD